MKTGDHRKEREEMEKKWADYDLRRSDFMKKMRWDERRMTKHETVCQKRAKENGPPESLVGICFGLAIAALFFPPVNQALHHGNCEWLFLLIFPIPAIPMGLAYLFYWLAKLMRDDLPPFICERS